MLVKVLYTSELLNVCGDNNEHDKHPVPKHAVRKR